MLVPCSWGIEWGEEGFLRMKRNVADKHGQSGLATMPGYAVKKHDNPDSEAAAIGRRGAGAKGAAGAMLSLLTGWVQRLQ